MHLENRKNRETTWSHRTLRNAAGPTLPENGKDGARPPGHVEGTTIPDPCRLSSRGLLEPEAACARRDIGRLPDGHTARPAHSDRGLRLRKVRTARNSSHWSEVNPARVETRVDRVLISARFMRDRRYGSPQNGCLSLFVVDIDSPFVRLHEVV